MEEVIGSAWEKAEAEEIAEKAMKSVPLAVAVGAESLSQPVDQEDGYDLELCGAGEGIRTLDFDLGKVAL